MVYLGNSCTNKENDIILLVILAIFQLRQFKGNNYFFTQLMKYYFNGHEYNTGFSTKCPGEENFSKQFDKSTETDRLREIPSSGN